MLVIGKLENVTHTGSSPCPDKSIQVLVLP